jgi:hypothetical protein
MERCSTLDFILSHCGDDCYTTAATLSGSMYFRVLITSNAIKTTVRLSERIFFAKNNFNFTLLFFLSMFHFIFFLTVIIL